jgi:tRNA(His) guanylyltransferase
MRFEELDVRLRAFETNDDRCVLPDLHIVVRLDGRGFTRQTREVWCLDAPFDARFRDHMLDTVAHLMGCGFGVVYGYTQSDEISLLLRRDDATFGRKTRKILSVLAGEASARFTLAMGQMACFDARICPLPTAAHVVDYFRWRHEDAHRNAPGPVGTGRDCGTRRTVGGGQERAAFPCRHPVQRAAGLAQAGWGAVLA